MLSREECKHLLLKECQVSEHEGKFKITRQTCTMVSKSEKRKELCKGIIFHTSKLPQTSNISERIFWIMYNINEIQKCQKEGCNNPVNFAYFEVGYNKHCCLTCSDSDPKTHQLRSTTWTTNIDENGLNSFDRKEIRRKENTLKKYNVEHTFQLSSVKEKGKQTKLNNIDETGLNGFQRGTLNTQKTKLELYDNASYNNFKKGLETKKNNIDENGLNSFERQAIKMIETKLKNIDENGLNGIERGILNSINKHGGKIHKSRIFYDDTKTLSYQGSHEKFFIDQCKQNNIEIQNFKKGIKYFFEGKDRWYFPDFIITDEKGMKVVVEIKATHHYFFDELKSGKLFAKWDAAENFIKEHNNEFKKFLFILNKKVITKDEIINQFLTSKITNK
jgi:hypothetical protein